MAKARKRAKNEVRRFPRWGATEAQGKRYQRERELKNQLASLRTSYDVALRQLSTVRNTNVELRAKVNAIEGDPTPVPMILTCPSCAARHIDVAFANKSHHTHACQHCGMCWRPAVVPTVGVQFLPGFHDAHLASGKGGAS